MLAFWPRQGIAMLAIEISLMLFTLPKRKEATHS
jgi:hypothetical protein